MTLRARRPYKTVGMKLWRVAAPVNVLIERKEAGLGAQAGSAAQHVQSIASGFAASFLYCFRAPSLAATSEKNIVRRSDTDKHIK